ncbi:hypothetical protein AC623_09105 [Bacillus sp. FJAT-27231]|uniref:hypothetical protein n=1 Tax=Bacillus sp. FJAT-27231 TaxID=1679168 RepID=UPI0006715814|nr:hypothetical protein [Bacillus sp. FJAT-27231]KMY54094.1 hypothetical protein AC623_09105 [Bacillus sp. FJAT-27231]
MKAYMVNDYHLFTNYKEVSTLIHDVVHYTELDSRETVYSFSIKTGTVNWEKNLFITDSGDEVPLKYEEDYDMYYSAL